MEKNKKRVYRFGAGKAEGNGSMRELLGGKGANLAEMNLLGMPVPAGFTITTECCTEYYELGGGYTKELKEEVAEALKATEKIMGMKFGDAENPLLVSCRSGARSSMPGMMDTILNIGLCSATIPGMIKKTNNPRFVYDAYRRLIMMYSDVVMEKAEGIEPEDGKAIRQQLDKMMEDLKESKGYKSDTEITAEELKELAEQFKVRIKEVLGVEFPDSAEEQLWGSIGGVFKSWNGKRAIKYRQIEGIPDDWGTAVNVQSMVWPSPATLQTVTTSSTANGLSTPRARTWLQVSVPLTRSTTQPRALRTHISLPSRRQCLRFTSSSTISASVSRSTSTICRTLSSPFRTSSSGCSSAVSARGPVSQP